MNKQQMSAEYWSDVHNMKNILHNCRAHTKFKMQQVIINIKKYCRDFRDVYELNQNDSYDYILYLSENITTYHDLHLDHASLLIIWVETWLALYEVQFNEDVTLAELRLAYENYKIVEHSMNGGEVKQVPITPFLSKLLVYQQCSN